MLTSKPERSLRISRRIDLFTEQKLVTLPRRSISGTSVQFVDGVSHDRTRRSACPVAEDST